MEEEEAHQHPVQLEDWAVGANDDDDDDDDDDMEEAVFSDDDMDDLEPPLVQIGGGVLGDDVEVFTEDEDELHDTTSEQLAAGRDIQGIPWDRLQFSRQRYRELRLSQYNNYVNVLPDNPREYREELAKTCTKASQDGAFFSFRRNHRSVRSNIVHFQLRNLLWASSRNDVFTVHDNAVNHFNPSTRRQAEVMNLGGSGRGGDRDAWGSPRGRGPPNLGRVQVSTMCVREGLVAAGGFQGELVCKRLDQATGFAYSGRVTNSENGITNGLEIYNSPSHGTCVVAANNDSAVRLLAADTFKQLSRFSYNWAVNYATARPEGHLLAAVGDDPVTQLTDMNTGTTVAQLPAHKDFSFAAAWHPHGNLLATGNQDTTTVVWDIRSTSAPLAILPGRMGAIRGIRFSPDGRFMAMAEPADFVHVYDVKAGFKKCQEIDLFGEIAGIAFTPHSDTLFISISDATYSSLLEFTRDHAPYL